MKLRIIMFIGLACCGFCPLLVAQDIVTTGATSIGNGAIILTPDQPNVVGGAYAKKNFDDAILEVDLTEGFTLEAAGADFGNKDNDGGHGFIIFLTTDSVFHPPSDFMPKGTGDTLGFDLGLSSAIGFEFDTHIAQDSAFHDYNIYEDHFALITEDITAPPLFGPVSLLHKRQNQGDTVNVETDSPIRIEIIWDPEERLLEVFTSVLAGMGDKGLRMSYQIDLIDYFGGRTKAYPGLVGATGNVFNQQTLTLVENAWFVKEDPRDIDDCEAVMELPNWIITNDPDYAYWDIVGTGDNAVQRDNGRPSFLVSPIKLIDVRMEGKIRVDAIDDDWIGVGWGMTRPFGQNYNTYDGFLLDFKNADQYWCDDSILTKEGFTVARLNGQIAPDCSSFIDHDSTNTFQVIDRQYGNEEGWEAGKEYVFAVEYTGHYFETWVTEEDSGDTLYHLFHENLGDTLFHPGRFAFYNNSQEEVEYSDFDYQYLHQFKASNYTPFTNEPVTFTYDFPLSDLPKTINDLHYKIGDSTTVNALNGDTIISIQHTFNLPGTYPVSLCLIDAASCEHLFSDTLTVREEPFFDLPEDTLLCPGEVLLLSTPYTGAEIIWQDSIEFPSFVVSESGEYWVSIRDGEYIQHDTITVRYADTIKYTLDVQTSCYQQDDGQVSIQILQATPPFEVMLDGNEGTQHNDLAPGIHHLKIEDKYGCTVEQFLKVPESCALAYEVQIDSTSCWGSADGLITVSDEDCPLTFSLNGATFKNAGWFDELEAGAYIITAIDSVGCQWDSVLTVPTPPPFKVTAVPEDTTVYLGACAPLELQLSYGDSAQINWTPNNSLNCGSCLYTLATPEEDQIYRIDVVNTKGCQASTTASVKIAPSRELYWPNTFSPNGDGYNDYFYPHAGAKRKGVKEISCLMIFDRGGSLVFARSNFPPDAPLSGWDGQFKSQEAPIGVYTVIARWEYIDGHTTQYRGDLFLKR